LLRVDFSTGRFENLSRRTVHHYEPLDETLRRTIALGGWKPMLIERLRAMGIA
jgi:hypothetical protein